MLRTNKINLDDHLSNIIDDVILINHSKGYVNGLRVTKKIGQITYQLELSIKTDNKKGPK